MWNSFKYWLFYHRVEVNWFLIGLFTAFGIDALAADNWVSALFNFGLAWINYTLRKI